MGVSNSVKGARGNSQCPSARLRSGGRKPAPNLVPFLELESIPRRLSKKAQVQALSDKLSQPCSLTVLRFCSIYKRADW